jgi:two-component system, OmpR family, sensor kinase
VRTRSIRARLTLWYAGSILLLLLTTTFVARLLVRDSLAQEFARSQETAATLVRGFFRAELNEYRDIRITVEHIVGELVIPDRHIHFVQPDGADFQPAPYVRVMPLPELAAPLHETIWLLDPDLAPEWRVRLTASEASLLAQQRQIDRWALLAIPFALGIAVFAGWMLTGRTLRPISAMADAADRITATEVTARIPIEVAGDELGRLGSRFNALLDRLDGALGQQRRFLADAAHELRTPIARARGAAELALSRAPEPGQDRAALEQATQELEAMSRLVHELLELARADASRAHPPLVRGFLDDVVTDVVHGFVPLAQRRGITLAVEVPHETPVLMDSDALARLVGILVHNAVRYSRADGTVHVRVRSTDTGARLEVEDAGIGIPAADRDRLFGRFFRGRAARQMAPEGSGLGLAIARGIADRHGARIAFSDAEPQGTRVTVTFPPA